VSTFDVRNLSVEYQTEAGKLRVVEDLSFSLKAGKSMGIVGESGCGKTTAMLAMMRLLPEVGRIVSGEVLLDGIDLMQLSSREMRDYRWCKLSMIFQGAMNALNPTRTVQSQIAEALRIHKFGNKNQINQEVENLLNMVGIGSNRASQFPHQYSGGMRQRAMIAMALACRPEFIIADEPTTALDVMVQAQILDMLKNLQKELRISIILVTHYLAVVAEFCDDALVMYGGWVAEYARSDIVFNKPRHPYTQRLLSAFPDIKNPGAELASIPGYPPPLNDLPPGCRFEPRCHKAIKRCTLEKPSLYEISPGHVVRCLRVQDNEI